MDYGKMAYLKTEELEARLLSSRRESVAVPALYRVRSEAETARMTLLSVRGANAVAVIVKLRFTSGGGTVHLSIGGLRAASARLRDGEDSAVMFGAGRGDVELDVSDLSGGARDIEADILLPEGASGVQESESKLKMAVSGDRYAICRIVGGDVELIGCDSCFGDRTRLKAGRGKYADVCAAGGGFCLVYGDFSGRLWSVALDARLNVRARSLIGSAPPSFDITAIGDRVYLFFAADGKIKYFSFAYPLGTRPPDRTLDIKSKADRVYAVKGASPIALVLSDGENLSLLKEETSAAATGSLAITVRGNAESV